MSTTRARCRRWYSIEYICKRGGITALRDWPSSDTYFPTNTQAYYPHLDTNSHYWDTLYLKQDILRDDTCQSFQSDRISVSRR